MLIIQSEFVENKIIVMMDFEQDYDQEDLQILQVFQNFSKEKLEMAKAQDRPQDSKRKVEVFIDEELFLSDTVLVMLAKEIEYVETLTRFKSGFLFNDRKLNIFAETVTPDLIPVQYQELWGAVVKGTSNRCRNLRKFFSKMLSSKNVIFAKECFLIYFKCLEHILFRQEALAESLGSKPITEELLRHESKLFSLELYGHIIHENEHREFVRVHEHYTNVTLLNKNIHLRELCEFQQVFRYSYPAFRSEFTHFLEVIYYCLELEYYGLETNYLYEGYYKNTELETVRGVPKGNRHDMQ